MSTRAVYAFSLLLAAAALGAPTPPRVLERYRQMLASNPVEGTALDRLWKAYAEDGQTGQLLAEYEHGTTFPERMILGLLQHRAGRDEEAALAWQGAAQLDSASPLPQLALAGLRTGQGKHAAAAAAYETALSLLPARDSRQAETLNNLGGAWLAAGDPEKASAAWEKTAKLDPTNRELRRRLAQTYREHRLPERALPHLEAVAAQAPANERAAAFQEISRVYQTLRRPDEAIHALEQAVALTAPGNWLWGDLLGQLIRLHQRFGRTAELEERWQKQAAASPRDLGALLQLLELYQRLGEQEQQRLTLEKLVALAPKTPAYRWQLARLLVELDRRPEAAALYDALLVEQPGQADATFERAKLEILAGQPGPAQARIAAYLARPGGAAARGRAVEFYREHRLWKEAEELLQAEATGPGEEGILALADFYFAQHREADAESTLRRLVTAAPARQRAAALVRIAQLLKGQNLLEATIRALGEAMSLAPGDAHQQREIGLLLAENQSTRGDFTAARTSVLAAVAASATPTEQEEAESRLFEVLRQLPDSDTKNPARRRGAAALATEEEGNLTKSNPEIARYSAELSAAAQANPTEQAWLRAARWKAWGHEAAGALEDVGRALALQPGSLPAHEAAVKLATEGGQIPAARAHLEALQQLDPTHAAGYRRRLVQLDLQAGASGEAIRALTDLVRGSPGNADLLTELAQAQQRAERWEEALATWQTILATSPAARRREATAPLLRIYERLHRPQPAAELLRAQFDAQTEPAQQLETFKDLLALCEKEGLLPWLHTEWEARRQGRLDDYAGEIAYAQILQAEGDATGAFTALSEALYTAPNPADALPELVRQAEGLRRLGAAIDFQARLVRLAPAARPEGLLKLAELQEKDFAVAEAEKTWNLALGRFPREVSVLRGAAEFHLRSGEDRRAAEELRRVRELEPTEARALFSLARLDIRNGELAEAEACLEQILRMAPHDRTVATVRFPALKQEDSSRLQATYLRGVRQRRTQPTAETMRALRGFWVEAPAENRTEDDLQLNAIRELATLMRAKEDPAALQKWIARWQARGDEEAGEVLWALFYAQAGEATLRHVEKLLQREPANVQYQQGYLWMALQLRQFPRLAAWLREPHRTVAERDFARIALSQYLQGTAGTIEPELLEALSAGASPGRLWELAQLCAASSCYREAVQLGRQACTAEKIPRAARGWELAQWELVLGEPESAQRRLAEIARQPGELFESIPMAALRAAYLLLPERERPAYASQVELGWAKSPPVSAAIACVVLHGLQGKDSRAEIRALVQMSALTPLPADEPGTLLPASSGAAERAWEFVRAGGVRLESWGLLTTAQMLWEEALADPSFIRLQGDAAQEIAREVRTSMLGLRVARAQQDDLEMLVGQSERPASGGETGISLGEAVESLGAVPRSLEILLRSWQRERSNGQILRNLLNVCRAADDTETAETVLQHCVSQRLFALNDNVHRDLVMQLVDLLERRDALAEARQVLVKAVESSPYDTRLLHRLAQLAQKAGDVHEAEALWRRLLVIEPNHANSKLGLAALLGASERRPEAIELLKKGTSPGVETMLAELLYAEGKVEEAMDVVERVGGTDRLGAPLALAKAMLAHGDRQHARALLQAAVAHAVDPATALQLQSLLIESFASPGEAPLIARELLRLRGLAGDDPIRLGVYFSFMETHADSLGIRERTQRELTAAWGEGAGLLQAGMVLLGSTLDREPTKAEAVLGQLLARPDLVEGAGLLSSLEAAHRPELAARVEERILRLNPGATEHLVPCVQRLVDIGQRERAETLLRAWNLRARLDDSLARPVAQAWTVVGHPEEAQALLQMVAAPRGIVRSYEPFLEHARLRLALGHFGPAKALLLRAFEHPGNHDLASVAEWLGATGKLKTWENEVTEFRFTPKRKEELARAVAAEQTKRGESGQRTGCRILSLGANVAHRDGPPVYATGRGVVSASGLRRINRSNLSLLHSHSSAVLCWLPPTLPRQRAAGQNAPALAHGRQTATGVQ